MITVCKKAILCRVYHRISKQQREIRKHVEHIHKIVSLQILITQKECYRKSIYSTTQWQKIVRRWAKHKSLHPTPLKNSRDYSDYKFIPTSINVRRNHLLRSLPPSFPTQQSLGTRCCFLYVYAHAEQS